MGVTDGTCYVGSRQSANWTDREAMGHVVWTRRGRAQLGRQAACSPGIGAATVGMHRCTVFWISHIVKIASGTSHQREGKQNEYSLGRVGNHCAPSPIIFSSK